MPKVLLLTRYERLGASSRVRFLQFLPQLAQAGFAIDVQPLLDNAYVQSLYGGPPVSRWSIIRAYLRRLRALLAARRYDVVWLEKEALPYLPAFVETALLSGVPYVVDLDDAWFHRYEAHSSALVRGLLSGKIDAVMRHAAIVAAGNDYLAARARTAGARRIEIIPTAIDLARYGDAPPAAAGKRAAVVGWIGIPLNAHYLTLIEPALRLDARDGPIKLHVVGAPVPSELAGIPAESFAWSEGDRSRAHRRLRHRHHAARRHAMGARQVRLQTVAGDGGGKAGDRLAGRRQLPGRTPRGERLPCGDSRGMGRGAAHARCGPRAARAHGCGGAPNRRRRVFGCDRRPSSGLRAGGGRYIAPTLIAWRAAGMVRPRRERVRRCLAGA